MLAKLQAIKTKTMASTKFYLDSRSGGAPYPLKLTVTHERKSVHLSLGVKLNPEQWDGTRVVKHPRAQMLNNQLIARKAEIDCRLYDWKCEGKLKGKSAKDIKVMIEGRNEERFDSVGSWYEVFLKKRSGRTCVLYKETFKRMREYADVDNMMFEEITPEWLMSFDRWLELRSPSVNARAIHLRNIRAVVNDAIDNAVTSYYAFRKFKIKREETVKRSLDLGQLRIFMNCEVEVYQEIYRDIFMLMIMLRGINIGDLCLLKDDNVVNGRVVYRRQKTHSLYSVRLEPEACEIIKKYKGENFLLNVCDRYSNYLDFMRRMNTALQKIGDVSVGKHGKKTIEPLFPKLSTYWARHTFATIAYNDCGIPMDVISDMLGHSNGMAVTNVYVRRNEKIADEAARKVIDKILYDK